MIYFILLQYGDHRTDAESVVLRYKGHETALKEALAHRADLGDEQIDTLARSVAFLRWPDPFKKSVRPPTL